MGERKGVNKYYPPDFDPSKGSLNSWQGTHPLRDRARKLHKGILIIRFEMPYNIWCGGCNNHIGMGVRYNAEKSKVGNYYTTPIYKFRMKCHLCDNHFEIQTDPKNHDYVILEGARRKEQRWDPRENEQIVPEDKATQKKMATDPMYKLEHGSDDKERGKVTQLSVAQIEDMRDSWNDDYVLNKMARNKFRGEKKKIAETKAADKALLAKSSLDIELVPETEEDKRLAGLIKYSVTKSYDEKQQEKRRAIENRPIFSKQPASCTLTPQSNGTFSRRAEIKHKLGLHLTSPKVEHTLRGSTVKNLVKNVRRSTKSSVSTDSLASEPAQIVAKKSASVDCRTKDDTSPQAQDAVRMEGKLYDHEKDSVEKASGDDINVRSERKKNGAVQSVSTEKSAEKDSFDWECLKSGDDDSCSIDRNDTENLTEGKVEDEKTGLAALMASYSDSDTNGSDS